MKYLHSFNNFLAENTLNYTQAMELGALGDAVKNYIKSNYYELYYGGPNNILGKYGKDIPGTSWKKLEKLAKDKGDKDLEIAITKYKDLAKKYKVKAFESLSENKMPQDKDHEITQAGNIWVLVYKNKHKTFKHHFGSEKEAEEFWNIKKENLKEGKTDHVINEDFPGPGETVLAKDITNAVLDYFDRTNKKLLIDTKTKKGITGEVGRMYNDLVFNGDTIKLKDIVQVKILESTNEAQKFNVKDLPKGAVLTFNDGETWMVTKVIGNSSNPQGYLLAPHGKTKEHYISMAIEFSIKKLEDDLVAVN